MRKAGNAARLIGAATAMTAFAGVSQAAISVVNDTNALSLAAAITSGGAGGITVVGASLSGHSSINGASSGIYTAGSNAYGLGGQGVVLSTGIASDYGSGPNTSTSHSWNWLSNSGLGGPGVPATAGEEATLDPITGNFDHYDVTTLSIDFIPDATTTGVSFHAVFGSDEFFEFVGTNFIDGFGMFLNGTNIAFTADGPVNINHPAANIPETELDGVTVLQSGSPLMFFGGNVIPNQVNNLTFIIADSTDGIYDSTVYIQGLGVPAPGALTLLGIAGLASARRRRA